MGELSLKEYIQYNEGDDQKTSLEEGYFSGVKLDPRECKALIAIWKNISTPKKEWKKDKGFIEIEGHVTELNLYGLGLKVIPPEIGELPYLVEINLSENNLTGIPDQVGKLTSLIGFNLSNNQIKELPETLVNLSLVKRLRINNNQLRKLPDSIGNLPNLRILNLKGNKLIQLPDSIGNLPKLKYLNLESNELLTLPVSFINLYSLKSLFIGKNLNLKFPEELNPILSWCIIVPFSIVTKALQAEKERIFNLIKNKDYAPSAVGIEFLDKASKMYKERQNKNFVLDKEILSFVMEWKPIINWILTTRITLTHLPLFGNQNSNLMLNRLTILIGQNNSGKTRTLKDIWNSLNNPNVIIQTDPPNKTLREDFQSFFIPSLRRLGEQVGTVQTRQNAISTFQACISELADIHSWDGNKVWEIPHLANLLDFLIFEEEKTDPDDHIPPPQKEAFLEAHQVYDRWVQKIAEFFPKIKIQNARHIKKQKISFTAKDELINLTLPAWHELGSGTQQLLSLVLIIEILKYRSKFIFPDEIPYQPINPRNIILLLDEPEVSLHPKLQRAFFQYLEGSASILQIIVATHSIFHSRPSLDVSLYLLKKVSSTIPEITKITKGNYLQVLDEMLDPFPEETAVLIAQNNYESVLSQEFPQLTLKMVQRLQDHFIKSLGDNSSEFYKDVLNLGTGRECWKTRLLQNARFLTSDSLSIDLNGEKTFHSIDQISLVQLHVLDQKIPDVFGAIFSKWDSNNGPNAIPGLLTYSKEGQELIQSRIKHFLERFVADIKTGHSLLLFPENSLPYSMLEYLIKYAQEHAIIIVGGMEHRKHSDIKILLNELPLSIKTNLSMIPDPITHRERSLVEASTLNLAVIINSNGRFTFQIKNYPIFRSARQGNPDLVEQIPILDRLFFDFYITSIGPLGVFICKDFLANYETIPIWMRKNRISLLLVPSFTNPVGPFLSKLESIVEHNRELIFVFANLGQYGGSRVVCFSTRSMQEPHSDILPRESLEGLLIFERNQVGEWKHTKRLNDTKLIMLE